MLQRAEEPLLMFLVKDGDPETAPGLNTTGDTPDTPDTESHT